ncbi:hypothetical protein [Billgrantia gudaonensis]|uniref:hypothetical protein n=1 Tax=Billgrantia gudaonensis TaxID=376427 RepID=UPI00159FD38C|nr:hypothetical protein [Halomonas gudaonensis]
MAQPSSIRPPNTCQTRTLRIDAAIAATDSKAEPVTVQKANSRKLVRGAGLTNTINIKKTKKTMMIKKQKGEDNININKFNSRMR